MKNFLKIAILSLFSILTSSCAYLNMNAANFANDESTGVLCIGMQQSAAFGSCPGAQLDATRMHELLSKYSKNSTLLLSHQATKTVVVKKMQEVCQKDLAIIYYSGHGGSQKQKVNANTTFIEPSGHDSFLCLYNTYMLDDEIWAIVSNAKGRVVLIFDCCHSATMFRVTNPFNFENERKAMAATAKKSPRILVLSGCDDLNYSYGGNDGGLMTNTLLRRFRENKTYKELFENVRDNKELAKSQTVHITEIGDSFKRFTVFK